MNLETTTLKATNEQLAYRVLNAVIQRGIREFCVCSGSRNSPFVIALARESTLKKYYWFEERSAAYFAIGRAKATQRPVAIITTSGTAAGELLPAAMEAHYTGTPILLITADRPRRFRGSGAPQSAEQEGLFGCYVNTEWDIAFEESLNMEDWEIRGPAHLNVCFEEPSRVIIENWTPEFTENFTPFKVQLGNAIQEGFHQFLSEVKKPLVIVSTLPESAKEPIAQFLLKLNAPVILEGVSKLREDPRLEHLKISCSENIWKQAATHSYPIDGILRIGGVPTLRLWRDLENPAFNLPVFSINDVPFSGLSRGHILSVDLSHFFSTFILRKSFDATAFFSWKSSDEQYKKDLLNIMKSEPLSEASMVHQLSTLIPENALVYLGNSLPIREWDQAATYSHRKFDTHARRGVNGIDGQISTFLGLCDPQRSNWAIIGDLTAMYDMVAPWIIDQIEKMEINIVVINNSGGKIFARMYDDKEFLNGHNLNFEHLARMWGLFYERWTHIPHVLSNRGQNRLIEIVPNEEATQRFWKYLTEI